MARRTTPRPRTNEPRRDAGVREADPWLKTLLARETPTLTRGAVVFTVPQYLPAKELRPDGMLVTDDPRALAELPEPWSLLAHEAVFEGKMPRDHADPGALQRLCFRREARQAQRIQEAADAKDAKARFDHDPARCAAWMLAPHVPDWVATWERAGWLRFDACGVGCWRARPFPYPVLWIAANELPLREALIPFLTARSGKKLEDFVRWVGTRRPPAWLAEMVRSLPEVTTMAQVAKSAWPPEVHAEMMENLARSEWGDYLRAMMMDDIRARLMDNLTNSDIGKDILRKGVEKGLGKGLGPVEHLFGRRLGRPLTAAEHATLLGRLDTLGPDRIGDVVLDLTPDALAAWLADPDAT